MYHLTPQWNYG